MKELLTNTKIADEWKQLRILVETAINKQFSKSLSSFLKKNDLKMLHIDLYDIASMY